VVVTHHVATFNTARKNQADFVMPMKCQKKFSKMHCTVLDKYILRVCFCVLLQNANGINGVLDLLGKTRRKWPPRSQASKQTMHCVDVNNTTNHNTMMAITIAM
jgi:hypothetical protein